MAIYDAGTTGNFVLPGTSVMNIKPEEKPLYINLPYGEKIKSTHTCQIDISWLLEAATRAHIVLGLAHKYLVSINILCDSGYKVEYGGRKCRVIFNHRLVWKGTREPTTGL